MLFLSQTTATATAAVVVIVVLSCSVSLCWPANEAPSYTRSALHADSQVSLKSPLGAGLRLHSWRASGRVWWGLRASGSCSKAFHCSLCLSRLLSSATSRPPALLNCCRWSLQVVCLVYSVTWCGNISGFTLNKCTVSISTHIQTISVIISVGGR